MDIYRLLTSSDEKPGEVDPRPGGGPGSCLYFISLAVRMKYSMAESSEPWQELGACHLLALQASALSHFEPRCSPLEEKGVGSDAL